MKYPNLSHKVLCKNAHFKKRAQVEVQFNWIYVMILGAIILAVFFGISLKMKASSNQETNLLLKSNLATILGGMKGVTSTSVHAAKYCGKITF